jgi:predicted acetyltransferase
MTVPRGRREEGIMVEIRELNEGDVEAWARIGAQAYRRGNLGDTPPRWPEGDFARFGLFERGQPVAQFHLCYFQMFFDGGRVPMGGIASVACLPLARGKGYVEALLGHGLERMREREQPFSALHAFLAGLYRPMGWETLGSRRSYTLPLVHLPAGLDTAKVRPAGPDDAETLRDLYERSAARYRGTLARPLSRWQERLEATTGFTEYFYLYEDPQPTAYLHLSMRDPARVRELVWETPEAYQALLGALRRHKSQLDQVTWEAPPDDPLWQFAAHWDVKVAWEAPFSGRIVDVPAAFGSLRPPQRLSGRCIIQVEDPLAPWNTGGWQVTVEDGAVTVQQTSAVPQVAANIGVWSQLLFGDPDAAALRRAGRLAVHDERGFDLLRALCPPALVWTNDGF